MSWVRLDDRFYSHRKVMSVSLAARWLYVSALCVANQHSNNGILDQAAQDCLLVAVGRSGSFDALAAELVSAGLWERHGVTDYTIHDYLEYQPSDAEQRKERAAAAERQRRFRERRHGGNATNNASSNGVTNGVENATPSLPVPSRPYPSRPGIKEDLAVGLAPPPPTPTPTAPSLPGLDPGMPKKPSKAPRAKSATASNPEIETLAVGLLAELSDAIRRVRPTARTLKPLESNLAHIRDRLIEGHSADDVRHVIAIYEAEAQHNPTTLHYFGPVTPFRAENFARTLPRTLDDARRRTGNRTGIDPSIGERRQSDPKTFGAWRDQ